VNENPIFLIFLFPRAGVGTQSGRASVQCIITERKEKWKFLHPTLARRNGIPTPARGNE